MSASEITDLISLFLAGIAVVISLWAVLTKLTISVVADRKAEEANRIALQALKISE